MAVPKQVQVLVETLRLVQPDQVVGKGQQEQALGIEVFRDLTPW
jgi:hypothetical protein